MEKEIIKNEVELTQEQETQKGASLVEYALLVALIAVVCIAAITILGGSVSQQFSKIASVI